MLKNSTPSQVAYIAGKERKVEGKKIKSERLIYRGVFEGSALNFTPRKSSKVDSYIPSSCSDVRGNYSSRKYSITKKSLWLTLLQKHQVTKLTVLSFSASGVFKPIIILSTNFSW